MDDSAQSSVSRSSLRQSAFLECEMTMEIDLGRLNALMAEPQCDHESIDARLQESHRRGVAQYMW